MSEDLLANVRRRVFSVMNKGRIDFNNSPGYDLFLEEREDVIRKFVESHLRAGERGVIVGGAENGGVEELEKFLSEYSRVHEEQVLFSRSVEDERKKEKLKRIVEEEGLFYERINADFFHRDKVVCHPLEPQYQHFVDEQQQVPHQSQSIVSNNMSNKRKRRTRPIFQSSLPSGPNFSMSAQQDCPISGYVEASGVSGLWKKRAISSLVSSLKC